MLRTIVIIFLLSFFSFANIPTPFNKQSNTQGNFSFTLTDFNLQVQVNRTYSTLQRNQELDFGYAWSIDYQNVKLQENTPPAKEWKITPDTLIGSCFKFDKSHQVEIIDNFFNFWFRFIYKYRSAIEIENYDYVKRIVKRDYATYSGKFLERYFIEKLKLSYDYSDIVI